MGHVRSDLGFNVVIEYAQNRLIMHINTAGVKRSTYLTKVTVVATGRKASPGIEEGAESGGY